MRNKWDFSGWATKTDVRCTDGRTIRKGAFSDCDGTIVPLVWNHRHNDPSEILGHALLEDRDGDIYAYCSFNNNDKGKECKELVEHGDITSLSIFANNLQPKPNKPPCDVTHGEIKEVSLVFAGANPKAFIDNVMEHGEKLDDAAEIFTTDPDDSFLFHSDEEEPEEDEIEEEVEEAAEEVEHADDEGDEAESEETVLDVLKTLDDKQKAAVGELISQMIDSDTKETEVEHSLDEISETTDDSILDSIPTNSEEEEITMKHNVFDTYENEEVTLSHSDMEVIFKDAKRLGSLRAAVEENLESGVLAHAVTNKDGSEQTYGIADINYLFPDARAINNTPEFIKRDTEWVNVVINGTHHTPFSRVKSMFADITMEEARARGYAKGKKKVEEVIAVLKRTTDPQTIYKKQKLDRDDIIDITDFDVVAWLKGEMRLMLDEELARAILISDGRPDSSDDKIQENHIRPIYNDDDLFTVKVPVSVSASATGDVKAKALIDAAIRSRKLYKGSGNPVFFTTEDWLTEILLLEDQIGHKLYKTEAEVATALRVSKIVTVEAMEGTKIGIKNGEATVDKEFIGVYVNLKDYNIGTNRGGQTSFFDDFDIDFNQQKYLLETRLSGALIKPKSAVSFYLESSGAAASTSDEGDGE